MAWPRTTAALSRRKVAAMASEDTSTRPSEGKA